MKRVPLKRRKGIRPMSRKREREAKLYSSLRREFLEARKTCEICGKMSQDVHHKAGRGSNYLAVDTWLSVCRSCHDRIHAHPAWARGEGYLE